jgi:hypothetical protein
VLLDTIDVYTDKMVGLSANCTTMSVSPFNSPYNTTLWPGSGLMCWANVSLSQADLEGGAFNITAYASTSTLSATGKAITAMSQQPVQLVPSPTLQLDLDVVADSCAVKNPSTTGEQPRPGLSMHLHKAKIGSR